jgi:2-amino-4-hydroxy-6-hydroxymethyldihydropteridine diphosphokinase
MHDVFILLGSNIQPAENICRTLRMLRIVSRVVAISTTWETRAVGSEGPDFLNTAVHVQTDLDREILKLGVLRPIEEKLGRVRTQDKNAPRTIDLDIIIFDGAVVDESLWKYPHVALPMAEFLPELRNPESGKTLQEVAQELRLGPGVMCCVPISL